MNGDSVSRGNGEGTIGLSPEGIDGCVSVMDFHDSSNVTDLLDRTVRVVGVYTIQL